MTASPTPFFAKPANKSDGEHYAGNASCSDHIGDANKMVAPDHIGDANKMVSAGLPSEEEIDRIVTGLYRRFKDWSLRGFTADDVTWCEVRADVADLIRPALEQAERERDEFYRDGLKAEDKWIEWEARALSAESKLAQAVEALEPFVLAFDAARERHGRRYGKDEEIGLQNFDKMPDRCPMDSLTFDMGTFRRARAAARGEKK